MTAAQKTTCVNEINANYGSVISENLAGLPASDPRMVAHSHHVSSFYHPPNATALALWNMKDMFETSPDCGGTDSCGQASAVITAARWLIYADALGTALQHAGQVAQWLAAQWQATCGSTSPCVTSAICGVDAGPDCYTQLENLNTDITTNNNVAAGDTEATIVYSYDDSNQFTLSDGLGPWGAGAELEFDSSYINAGGGGPCYTCNPDVRSPGST